MSYMGRASRIEQTEPSSDGWNVVTIRFDVEEEACQFALSFGSESEVLEPESLREKVIAAAQGTLDLYAKCRAASA
jgi:predicted DNA-binding transcriptional regulator YafY